jgi:uncharacterized membrane protein
MEIRKLKEDKYFIALVVICALLIIYWVSFQSYRYDKFISGYYDIGAYVSSYYWHVHGLQYYPNILDYIVFGNHISLFSLFIVPVFAIYQRPITLYLMQDIVLMFTALVVYFVSSDLLKSNKIGFAFAVAFLINPATIGLLSFDFHVELFTALFYILSFYFYMKQKPTYFIISYVLLLSILEVEPVVGLSLLVVLLVYELIYHHKAAEREVLKKSMVLLGAALIITIAFSVFYISATKYIINSYATISESAIVPIQRLQDIFTEQTSKLTTTVLDPNLIVSGTTFGLVVFFFGFGVSSFVNPLISLISYSPWLFEVLIAHNVGFTSPATQYYSYALGGSVISAILGYMILSKTKLKLFGFELYNIQKNGTFIAFYILLLAVFISVPVLGLLGNLLQINYAPKLNYTQINDVLKTIPNNSTVMAQGTIAPHLYYIHNLELSPVYGSANTTPYFLAYWVKPKYIILDTNLYSANEFSNSTSNESFNIHNYTEENNYTLYYNKSGLMIYKK